MKKLVLINPVDKVFSGKKIRKSSNLPPLGLGIVAALTPDDWDVKIIDENFTDSVYEDADLAGITACTASANRAYEIAKIYRDKRIPVIMGGIHASLCSKEAAKYVDSVVVGEAEGIWAQVISDFQLGKSKKIYRSKNLDLSNMPIPRHDLFYKHYMFGAIQTARGCPMDCEFCSVTSFNGHTYRQRPIEDVLDELEKIPQKLVFFVDDNIIGYGKKYSERALDLFKGMIRRGIKKEWFCQASLNFADNEEILKYAAKSGCRMVILGLEADTAEPLKKANKKMNLAMGVESYENIFAKIHKYGIAVVGAFIYGFDSDTPEILDDRTNYIIKSGVDVIQTTFLTPLPGTRLFEKMLREDRLLYTNFPSDWNYFDVMTELVFKPELMDINALRSAMDRCNVKINKAILKKFFKTLSATRNFKTAVWALITNIKYQNVRKRKNKLNKLVSRE